MQLNGKLVLVTGASRGIGAAIARELAAAGARVAVSARSEAPLRELAAEIRGEAIAADISEADACRRLMHETFARLGGLDILINNAGYGHFKPLEEVEAHEFDHMMAVNVRAPLLLAKYALPELRRRHGAIVNVSSIAGTGGFAHGSSYVATKFALRGLSQCWMQELRGDNIRVLCVQPGSTLTDFNDGMMRKSDKRVLHPEDVARIVRAALELDDRAMVSEITIRPTNP